MAEGGAAAAPPAGVPANAATPVPPCADERAAPAPEPLPPVDSLTFDSDFTPFMREGVDPGVKRAALKALLRDPRFNVMDGLDVYIDDYSRPDPIPVDWLEKLNQLKNLGHPVEEPAPESAEEQDSGAQDTPAPRPQALPHDISDRDIPDAPQQEPQVPKTPDRDQ